MIFDDTFNHEVWNDTDETRVVLFVDVLRPLPSPSRWSTRDRQGDRVLAVRAGCQAQSGGVGKALSRATRERRGRRAGGIGVARDNASHVPPLLTGGTSVPGLVPTRNTPSVAGVMMTLATGSLPVSAPLTLAMANVTSWTPGAPGFSTTWRLMFIVGSSMRVLFGGNGTRWVTFSIRTRVT